MAASIHPPGSSPTGSDEAGGLHPSRTLVTLVYRRLTSIGRHRTACSAGIFLFTLLFRLTLSPILPHPVPSAHDEFAYLLGGDLIAHGEFSTPPHPFWQFFESVHVLSNPVYAPKYPPAQSVFLALGQALLGDPFYGVLFSVGLFSAAVCWMLQAYVKPAWALTGGVATMLYYGAGHYWTESYWGGAVAGLGAALLIGGYGRFGKGSALSFNLAFGAGAVLLTTSRPYESALLIVFACAGILIRLLRARGITLTGLGSAFTGAAVALLLTLGYNFAVTGNAFEMPYQIHRAQYSANPVFWFQDPYPSMHYENESLDAAFDIYERGIYDEISAKPAWESATENTLTVLFTIVYDGGALGLLPLLFVPLFLRDRRIRTFAAWSLVLSAAVIIETFLFLHYMAPVLVINILLTCLVLERLWRLRTTRARDRAILVAALSCAMLAGPFWRAGAALTGHTGQLYKGDGFGQERARVADQILANPGEHVVFVHYTPEQNPMHAWVANGADIDGERLVWAHDRGAENQKLLDYFPHRTAWILEDRKGEITLTPYAQGGTKAVASGR